MARLNSRRKGKASELEAAHLLSDLLGSVVKRQLGQSRDGGFDLAIGSKYAVEVKRRRRISTLYRWVRQVEDCCKDRVPLVMCRADGEGWLVVLRLPDAVDMIREAIND